MKKLLAVITLFILFGGAPDAFTSAETKTPALGGTWSFSLKMMNGVRTREYQLAFDVALKQQGRKLTGTCSVLGVERKVTGTVIGNKVTIMHEITGDAGRTMKASYKGMLESPAKMTGSTEQVGDPDGVRLGTWTATKK